ncbi:HD-GYP domain-containing protein [Hydrogenophaga sp.]|uniref:HD-GYP domain-containing protein n=1 Tax=Hydrogenophaga sp. TaxID=1904254 RepID=UPI003F6C9F1F
MPPTALAAHHGRHSEFSDQLTQFSALWAQGGQQAAALHRFLSAWLIVHILGEDREMVQRLSQLPDAAVQAPRTLGDGEVVLLEAVRNLQGALAGHSRRVAELAQRLAKQLGLDDLTVQQVLLGGLLHDIGKIGLPDELLGKPVTQMNAQEVALYRKHPVAGVQALIALDDLQPAANALRSHHERFDGKGFPDGLAGEAIPLEARILAVANDFDGLQYGLISSRRLSVNEALQFVQDQVDQRYDPQGVGTLLQVMGRSAEGRGPERVVLSAELMPGMTLSRDLVTPEGMLLLAADSPLEAGLIRRIQVYLGQAGHRPLQVHVRHEAPGVDMPAPGAA